MLSALVFLPKGASRDLLLKELRRLRVRVMEVRDPENGLPAEPGVDFVVVGSDAPHARPFRKRFGSRRAGPPVIMVETSKSLHASTGYDENMWCLHRPVKPCILRAYVQSIMERKQVADRLSRLLVMRDPEEHTVDDLWFAVFEKLKKNSKK